MCAMSHVKSSKIFKFLTFFGCMNVGHGQMLRVFVFLFLLVFLGVSPFCSNCLYVGYHCMLRFFSFFF